LTENEWYQLKSLQISLILNNSCSDSFQITYFEKLSVVWYFSKVDLFEDHFNLILKMKIWGYKGFSDSGYWKKRKCDLYLSNIVSNRQHQLSNKANWRTNNLNKMNFQVKRENWQHFQQHLLIFMITHFGSSMIMMVSIALSWHERNLWLTNIEQSICKMSIKINNSQPCMANISQLITIARNAFENETKHK
jgi:hypothetical protein